MVLRYGSLSERQLEVLMWIHDGCPGGVWTDFTYKRTTYALADWKLVTVDKRRGSWSASITDDGRYYLEHGTYKVEQASAAVGPTNASPKELRGYDSECERHS